MKQNQKAPPNLFAISLAFVLISLNASAQTNGNFSLTGYEMQKLYGTKDVPIKPITNWQPCNFEFNFHGNKEIDIVNKRDSTVVTWFTLLEIEQRFTDPTKGMLTYNCIDRHQKNCIITQKASSNVNSDTLLITVQIMYPDTTGTTIYAYHLK